MNALNTTDPTPPCVCGWNTPDHNGEVNTERTCPAVKAATKQLFDQGYSTTKQTRWSNYYVDPDDVAIIVLNAVQAQQAEALAALAEQFEPEAETASIEEQIADVIPIRRVSVKTSSSPLNLDPHESYYRPPYIGRADEHRPALDQAA
jgi:hypothetical protein